MFETEIIEENEIEPNLLQNKFYVCSLHFTK